MTKAKGNHIGFYPIFVLILDFAFFDFYKCKVGKGGNLFGSCEQSIYHPNVGIFNSAHCSMLGHLQQGFLLKNCTQVYNYIYFSLYLLLAVYTHEFVSCIYTLYRIELSNKHSYQFGLYNMFERFLTTHSFY